MNGDVIFFKRVTSPIAFCPVPKCDVAFWNVGAKVKFIEFLWFTTHKAENIVEYLSV